MKSQPGPLGRARSGLPPQPARPSGRWGWLMPEAGVVAAAMAGQAGRPRQLTDREQVGQPGLAAMGRVVK